MNPETLHDLALMALGIPERFPPLRALLKPWQTPSSASLAQMVAGRSFPNPVGLAAGWDKNAKAPHALAGLGFGFLELGTVTLWPEPGNPRPRIFRSRTGKWIANRVGFANDGAAVILGRLQKFLGSNGLSIPMGISLGKMPASPPEKLAGECAVMLEMFYPVVDFFTINVSSPNTPAGWRLTRTSYLDAVLQELMQAGGRLAGKTGLPPKPIFVKIPPMLEPAVIEDLAEVFLARQVAAVIATNSAAIPGGGLSGSPLKAMALKTTARLFLRLKGKVPIIGVGGILTPQDAGERILAGAALLQIFSGFVFSGPGIIGEILRHLDFELKRSGFDNINQAIGTQAKRLAV